VLWAKSAWSVNDKWLNKTQSCHLQYFENLGRSYCPCGQLWFSLGLLATE
jgi:hypothetical protein